MHSQLLLNERKDVARSDVRWKMSAIGLEASRRAMIYKELAKTGVLIPELGLGTWQYCGSRKALQEGLDLGATFIDTAEFYGSEELVGQAIAGIRHGVFLATKVSPRHFRRHDVIRAADESLKRLRTDYIDLYQLHWPNYIVPIAETMSAMELLVEAGKVRFIGVCNFFEQELNQAEASLSKTRVVSNQIRYNIVDRTIEDGLYQYCETKGITILAYSPLAQGLENIRKCDPTGILDKIAAAKGKTPAQVALNWCTLHNPVIAIFKSNKVEHVRESCGASGWRLDSQQIEALSQIHFVYRHRLERSARRLVRRCLQRFGRKLG